MNKHYAWLKEELPSWIAQGIITQEGSEKLLTRYAQASSSSRSGSFAFSIVGAVLVGLGIISILGYNWEYLGHMARTLLAFGLLLSAQALALWVVKKRPDEHGLKEASAFFLFLMMGASLAIIGQTYHLAGNLGAFLEGWLLLTFLLMWVMDSKSVAIGSTVIVLYLWVECRTDFSAYVNLTEVMSIHFPLLGAVALSIVAFYGYHIYKNRLSNGTMLLSWAIGFSLLVVLGIELFDRGWRYHTHLIVIAAFFGCYYLLGKGILYHGSRTFQRPFEFFGKWILMFMMIFSLSYHSWELFGLPNFNEHMWNMPYAWDLVFLAYGILLGWEAYKKRLLDANALFSFSALILIVYISFFFNALFINSCFILGCAWMIYKGSKEGRMGTVNQGMILLTIAIWIHFFDADFGLVVKGVAFIVTGLCFLVANSLLRRYMKEHV